MFIALRTSLQHSNGSVDYRSGAWNHLRSRVSSLRRIGDQGDKQDEDTWGAFCQSYICRRGQYPGFARDAEKWSGCREVDRGSGIAEARDWMTLILIAIRGLSENCARNIEGLLPDDCFVLSWRSWSLDRRQTCSASRTALKSKCLGQWERCLLYSIERAIIVCIAEWPMHWARQRAAYMWQD